MECEKQNDRWWDGTKTLLWYSTLAWLYIYWICVHFINKLRILHDSVTGHTDVFMCVCVCCSQYSPPLVRNKIDTDESTHANVRTGNWRTVSFFDQQYTDTQVFAFTFASLLKYERKPAKRHWNRQCGHPVHYTCTRLQVVFHLIPFSFFSAVVIATAVVQMSIQLTAITSSVLGAKLREMYPGMI